MVHTMTAVLLVAMVIDFSGTTLGMGHRALSLSDCP